MSDHENHDQGVTLDHTPDQAPALSQEAWDAQLEEGREELSRITAETTQREWLQITTRLGRTRQQIGEDSGLTMLALGWVKEKRAHGGASWDRLLDMTDVELEALHGLPPGSRPE